MNLLILVEIVWQVHGLDSTVIDTFSLPGLPLTPKTFRGIRKKQSLLKRWLNICADDSMKNGGFRRIVNLLRKYLGDILIASYLHIVEESSYDDTYVQEIEEHDITTVGILLGMAASYRGAMHPAVSKMLFLHIPSRYPSSFIELDLPTLMQSADGHLFPL